MQDSITHEALEALADRLDAGDPSSLSTASNMLDAIAQALRTGQLILAQPSGIPDGWGDWVESDCPSCHGQNISCPDGCGRDPETGELNGTRLQPSGDEVEAVAELQLAAFLAGRGSVVSMKQGTRTAKPAPTMDEFRRMARNALEAHRGKQACLKARENSDG